MAPGLHDEVVGVCRAAGFSPRVVQEAVQMQTIVSLVSAELGVALIPASLTNLRRTGVTYKVLRERSPLIEIHLAWRRDDELPALKTFVELAVQSASESKKKAARRSTP
jgi:DNA-binding transcriptional LysR family regulator